MVLGFYFYLIMMILISLHKVICFQVFLSNVNNFHTVYGFKDY